MTQTKLVILADDCTVTHINNSYQMLVEAFERQGPIVVDLSQVAAADVTLIQLILSASRTAALQDRAFSLKSVPNRLQAVLGSAGISLNLESGQILH